MLKNWINLHFPTKGAKIAFTGSVAIGMLLGYWVGVKVLGLSLWMDFKGAAVINPWGWFGVFYGIFAFCVLIFAIICLTGKVWRSASRR